MKGITKESAENKPITPLPEEVELFLMELEEGPGCIALVYDETQSLNKERSDLSKYEEYVDSIIKVLEELGRPIRLVTVDEFFENHPKKDEIIILYLGKGDSQMRSRGISRLNGERNEIFRDIEIIKYNLIIFDPLSELTAHRMKDFYTWLPVPHILNQMFT